MDWYSQPMPIDMKIHFPNLGRQHHGQGAGGGFCNWEFGVADKKVLHDLGILTLSGIDHRQRFKLGHSFAQDSNFFPLHKNTGMSRSPA